MEYSCSQYSNVFPGYLGNTLSRPFYHSDLKNTLEGIVIKETPEKQQGILEKVFSDKGKTLKGTVKALLNEIKLRETLDSHLIKKIEDEICSQNTYLLHLKDLKVQYSFELSKNVSNSKAQIESKVLELEKEKRQEQLECWRDLMFLKKYLLTSLKDYWELTKKREVLKCDFGGFL